MLEPRFEATGVTLQHPLMTEYAECQCVNDMVGSGWDLCCPLVTRLTAGWQHVI